MDEETGRQDRRRGHAFRPDAGLPKEILDRLSRVLKGTVKDAKIADQLAKNGAEPTVMKPEEFRKLISDELETYGKIVASLKKGS